MIMNVLLGMSGGVDSSTAAIILKREGHHVEGLSLRLFEARGRISSSSCCSLMAINDARSAAETAGIKHSTADARDLFTEKVIEPFLEGYAKGFTPNPCVLCNQHVKFPLLAKEAKKRGFTRIATGHYAIVERTDGRALLRKGIDTKKDQSYFLYPIGTHTLGITLFPLGRFSKEDIRRLARQEGLKVFNRPESQEICFVENDDYASTLRSLKPDAEKQGPIIGPDGDEIGQHRGTINFTPGQRKGLGISWPYPLYVTRIDSGSNTVYVGPREKAMWADFHVGDIVWLDEKKCAGGKFRAGVKVRSTMSERPATIVPINGQRAHVRYDEPEFAPAPGQSAVFYDNDIVLGGGVIE